MDVERGVYGMRRGTSIGWRKKKKLARRAQKEE
jgi:hypothetical protein